MEARELEPSGAFTGAPVAEAGVVLAGRFELLRLLGEGGMGSVFEAFDRKHRTRVALKSVRARSPEALLALKREFRSLAGIRHPSVVDFIELVEDRGGAFFTMELLEGEDFLEHVRPGVRRFAASGESRTLRRGAEDVDADNANTEPVDAESRSSSPPATHVNETRLLRALAELAEALALLHDRGLVHRDVKPANVLVTRDERVVLVDFGLAELERSSARPLGTRAFMAPEQASGNAVGSASDLYACGVMLYLALSGDLPFRGAELERRRANTTAPSLIGREGVPADLAELCAALLDLEPERRPSARDVLARLGRGTDSVARPSGSVTRRAVELLGRTSELELLDAAARDAAHGFVTAVIVGESGVGKSALVAHFIAELARRAPRLLHLASRCHERELLPFKAFDGIVDELFLFLAEPQHAPVLARVEADARMLSRIFPVLARLPGLTPRDTAVEPATPELRARAFAAFRSLLAELARDRALVLVIDDWQWADADSAHLFEALASAAEALPLLVLITARTLGPEHLRARRLELTSLTTRDAEQLATQLLGEGAQGTLAADIARAAAGHPLFVVTLCDEARLTTTSAAPRRPLALEAALFARIERADPAERRLLELVAVADAALPEGALLAAAGLDAALFAKYASSLAAQRLVRSATGRGSLAVEPYHDRIRETLLDRLAPSERQGHHRRLARALELTGEGTLEPLALVRHLEGSGDDPRAAEQALRAAEHAEHALAFDQAAMLSRTALRLGHFTRQERLRVTERLARALVNAGRGAEAAEAQLACAELCERAERLEYQRRAADQWLRAGHFDAGMRVLSDVLAEIDECFPRSPRHALASIVFERLRARLTASQVTTRDETSVPTETLLRLDIYHAVSAALSLVDMLRAAYYQNRSLALALETGEPKRLARCLVLEAIHTASQSERGLVRGRAMLAEVRAIVARNPDPYLEHAAELCAGFLAYHAGAFREAETHFALGAAGFANETLGTYHERTICRNFGLVMLRFRGRLGALQAGFLELLQDAEQRSDRFTEAGLRLNLNVVWLARDEPERAARELEFAGWVPPAGYAHTQEWYAAHGRAELDLYRADAAAGLARFEQFLTTRGKAFIFRVRSQRALRDWTHARLVLAAMTTHAHAAASRTSRTSLRQVERAVAALKREGVPFARSLALLLRAALEVARGDEPRARRTLAATLDHARTHDLAHVVAAAEYRLAELESGEASAMHRQSALTYAAREGIVNPERLFAVWAPGFAR